MGEIMAGKKFTKCKVCGDIHFGIKGPNICPTCGTVDAYQDITKDEAKKSMGL